VDLGEEESALEGCQRLGGEERRIGVGAEVPPSRHGLEAFAECVLPSAEPVGEGDSRAVVVLGELTGERADRAAAARLVLVLERDGRVQVALDPGHRVDVSEHVGLQVDDGVAGRLGDHSEEIVTILEVQLELKRVLVTGGTSGIGRAAAEQFAAAGAEVIVSGRDQARGEEVVGAIERAGGHARFIAADLATPDGARELAEAAGDVDVLINNAGVYPFAATHETTGDQIDEVLYVNVAAPFQLTGALAPGMAARGSGAVINVSTMAASIGLPGAAVYGASKAAVELLTKAWAAEYGASGVRVNAVAPGPTRTPGTEGMGDGLDEIAATLPLGRPARAEEIARTIVFLASDNATYVNGAILAVDGGRTAI
jgi:NAD(P)-dependent dehydrogenase (short-subunit alcohol dehydrogenase family)